MHPSSTAPCHGDPLIQSFIWNATVTLGTRQCIGAIQRFINGSGDVRECGLQVPKLGEDLRPRRCVSPAGWHWGRAITIFMLAIEQTPVTTSGGCRGVVTRRRQSA